jgi:biotin carboxyl carrier protein
MAEKYVVRGLDAETEYEIDRTPDGIRVRRAGDSEWKEVELQPIGDSRLYLLMLDNHPTELYLERRRGGAVATIGRHAFDFDVEPWRLASASRGGRQEAAGPRRIVAPMTGSIVEVRCSPGQDVQAGDVLLVIESMKMNNELRSPAAGTVEAVPVGPGQRVNAGDVLVALHLKGE